MQSLNESTLGLVRCIHFAYEVHINWPQRIDRVYSRFRMKQIEVDIYINPSVSLA